MKSDAKMRVLMGPVGCLAPETLVLTEYGPLPIWRIDRPMRVVSWNGKTDQFQLSWCGGSFPKGTDYLYRVSTPQGGFVANEYHRTYASDGSYQPVGSLSQGQSLRLCSDIPALTSVLCGQTLSLQDVPHLTQKAVGSLAHYAESARQCGLQLLQDEGIDLNVVQALSGAQRSPSSFGLVSFWHTGGRWGQIQEHIRQGLCAALQRIDGFFAQVARPQPVAAGPSGEALFEHNAETDPLSLQYQRMTGSHQQVPQSSEYSRPHVLSSISDWAILSVTREGVKRSYWDMQVLDTNNYVTIDGTIHHNSGKSVTCSFEVIRRASMQEPNSEGVRKSRWAVVRQTARQLSDTTIKTFLDWFPPGPCGQFMRTTKTYLFKVGDVEAEIMFRALDDADDVANLNSLELTGAWFNECRDIHPDIVDAMSKRVGRFPSKKDGGPTWHGMWGDTNPPVMESWWYYQMEKLDPVDGVSPNNNGWAVFKQPSGRSVYAENVENLPEGYYDTQGRSEDYIRVYIDGEYGLSSAGQPVFKYFRPDYHMAKSALKPITNGLRPVVIGMDLGLTPAAVIGQQDPRGRALILAEAVSFDMGIQRFVRSVLKPLLFERFSGVPVVVVTDPAGVQRAQTDERSAIDIIKAEGLKVIPARTNSIQARLNAVDDYLMRQVDGDPALLVDPSCTRLKAAFMGGYRFKPKGDKVIDKNEHSHIADATQYLLLHISHAGDTATLARKREVKPIASLGWT